MACDKHPMTYTTTCEACVLHAHVFNMLGRALRHVDEWMPMSKRDSMAAFLITALGLPGMNTRHEGH